jgi:hypothetical protein
MALTFVAESAYHFTNHDNHDKIWAAGVATDAAQAIYIAVWGKRMGAPGAWDHYQSGNKNGTLGQMRALYDSKVREKLGKGYVQVPFGDSQHGTIPSFSGGSVVVAAGSKAAASSQQITASNLLAQIENLIARVVRKKLGGPEMSSIIMEFQQVKAKTEIFVEFGGASNDDKLKIAGLTGQLQSNLQAALVG